MRLIAARAAALAVATLLTAARSPSTRTPTMPVTPDDACSLLTEAQISAVLGANVGAGKPAAPTLCQWSDAGGAKVVNLFLMTAQEFERHKAFVDKGMTTTPASGIGDDAFFQTGRSYGTLVEVKKGAGAFQVKVNGPFTTDQKQAMEKTLAQDVLAKM